MISIPHPYVGQRVTARADTQVVRFYARGLLIKTHPRQAPGGQSIVDASDYLVERSIYATRNVEALRRQATLACDTSMPSFCNSPWIRGAPQSGFA